MPEILDHAQHVDLPGLDRQRVIELKMDGTRDEELYRDLLLAQCHGLHQAMPFLFEPAQVEQLLRLAEALPDARRTHRRGATYRISFALMYSLGLRVGEVTRYVQDGRVNPVYAAVPEEVPGVIEDMLQSGDVVLTLGAGSVGAVPAIRSYIIIVLGGLGSVPGALLGGLIIGLVEALGAGCYPDPSKGAAYRTAFGLLIFAIVLLVRPTGLFGREPS